MSERRLRTLAWMCAAAVIFWLAGPLWPGRGVSDAQVARTHTGQRLKVSAQMTSQAAAVSFHVDGMAGNDANDGTPAKPFKSVQRGITAAADQNRLGRPVTVYLKPATYREAVAFPNQKFTGAPIALVSTVPGGAVIDGSDVYRGWTLSSGTVYVHSWTPLPACTCPYDPQHCPPGIGMRREMVFINGQLLAAVASRAAMKAGTYYADDRAQRLYVWTPSGESPDVATTSVSTRGSLFAATTGVQSLTLDGLLVRGSADCAAVGAAIDIQNVAKLVLRDVSAVYNNDEGIFLGGVGTGGTLKMTRVHADNNGFIGMNLYKTKNLSASNITTNGNNWRGNWVRFGGWFIAGVKFGGLHDAMITGWTSVNNPYAVGFWLDTDGTRVTVNDLVVRGGGFGGVVLEAIQGPVVFNRAVLCMTATDRVQGGAALTVQAAANIRLNDSIIFEHNPSGGSLIAIGIGANDPASVLDWETGANVSVTTKSWGIMHTAVVIHGAGTNADYVVETDATKRDFWSTLVADYNLYWDPATARVWRKGDAPNGAADFSAYKAWLRAGQETHSAWANPFSNDPTDACTFAGAQRVWPR